MVKGWKKACMSMAVAALVLVFVVPASAQRRTMDPVAVAPGIPVNEMIGMDVRTLDGDTVGKIDDVIVTRQGRVRDVIVDLSGTGDRVAVPMQDLRFTNQDYATYRGSRADLEDRPGAVYGYRSDRNYTDRSTYYSDRDRDRRYDHNKPQDTQGYGGRSNFGHWAPSYQRGYYDLGYWPSDTGVVEGEEHYRSRR